MYAHVPIGVHWGLNVDPSNSKMGFQFGQFVVYKLLCLFYLYTIGCPTLAPWTHVHHLRDGQYTLECHILDILGEKNMN